MPSMVLRLVLVLVTVLLGACSGGSSIEADEAVPPLHPSIDGYPETVVTMAGPDDATQRVAVKVADTPERRQHGLMEVEELPDGTGMLFVFGEDRTGAFWMKDTLVPLSIAFVGADGELLAILDMEPCEADPCERYDPDVAYRYALEVPQGWFAEVGIDDSWRLERPLPAPSG